MRDTLLTYGIQLALFCLNHHVISYGVDMFILRKKALEKQKQQKSLYRII